MGLVERASLSKRTLLACSRQATSQNDPHLGITELDEDTFYRHYKKLPTVETLESFESPEVLFHYTSMTSLEKILTSHLFRATHSSELDDTTEIILGYDLLERMFRGEADWPPPFKSQVLGQMDAWRRNIELYISCFSPTANNDHLWKKYASNGKGICIGFETTRIPRASRRPSHRALPVLSRVQYEENALVEVIRTIADGHLNLYQKCIGSACEEKWANHTIRSFVGEILGCISSHKNDSYKDEEEVRLIYPATEHASGNYAWLSLDANVVDYGAGLPICKVVVGDAKAFDKVRSLLGEHGYHKARALNRS